MSKIIPIDRERFFSDDEVIVSKTDLRGVITYANDVFSRVCGYTESELLGKPHSIVRHPDMPRCVFKYLWDTIAKGDEVFAYVKNMAKTGEYYWVLAHVTATFDNRGQIIGYHSTRRVPNRAAVETLIPIYASLLELEQANSNGRLGLQSSYEALCSTLTNANKTYDEFVWSITPAF